MLALRPFRSLVLAVFVLILAATGGPHAQAPVLRPAPKLVVILVVDQFRADYVEKFGGHWTAGLRRLTTDAAWFREAAYPYLTTVTCAGHSTIVTGSLPATHGMVSNTWWDRASGQTVGCVADAGEKLVSYAQPAAGRPGAAGGAAAGATGTASGAGGQSSGATGTASGAGGQSSGGAGGAGNTAGATVAPAAGTSVKNLRVLTLADEMRAQMRVPPRVVTISLKEYTATTMAGRRADAATWFNPGAHSWMTTTAFTRAPVPFVARFVASHPIDKDFRRSWTKLLPESAYLYEDEAVGEDTGTWGRTFPHVLAGTSGAPDTAFYVRWDTSPFSDDYLGAMAQDAVDALKLGQGAGTDYLAVSFSALDMVGHEFGPRSHEVQDVLARLDLTLGALLSHLDERVGRGNYVLALTGDHGVAPIPEQMAALGLPAGRVLLSDVLARGNKALEEAMGPGAPTIARIVYNDLYFNPGDWAKVAARPEAVRALLDAIRSVPGMARVLRGDRLDEVAGAAAADRVERAARWSYFAGRSGDLVLVPLPYYLYAASGETASGTGHGGPYGYDQRVPLFLYGTGIKAGEYLESAGPMDIAPTLAFLCGIELSSADGRVLREALR